MKRFKLLMEDDLALHIAVSVEFEDYRRHIVVPVLGTSPCYRRHTIKAEREREREREICQQKNRPSMERFFKID